LTTNTDPILQNFPSDLTLWDVVEEHFEEAEFLFGQWEQALHSPKYNLSELGETLERRLEAHLDGLVVGGREVAVRVLYPNLQNADEPGRATVTALALLLDGTEETAVRVLDVAQHVEGALQEALARALVLADVAPLDRILLERFRAARLVSQDAVLLEILTGRRVDVGDLLYRCFESNSPLLIGAALEAAGRFGRRDMMAVVESYLCSDQPTLQSRALKASLALGSRSAWDLCLQLVESSSSDDPDLPLLVAILGQSADHQILYQLLDDPARLERKLWNLGFCGTVQAGDVCVSHLQCKNERVAKVAAESMAWIGGLDLNKKQFQCESVEPEEDETLPPIAEDDLDGDLGLDGVDDLPVPNREAIAQWWGDNRGRLTQSRRCILGQTFSPEAILHALEGGPLWRRRGVAWELSIRTGGREFVSTGVFSSRQRRQMAALAGTNRGRWDGN
jgi:uncharacterized protein (TIGR02270 family)